MFNFIIAFTIAFFGIVLQKGGLGNVFARNRLYKRGQLGIQIPFQPTATIMTFACNEENFGKYFPMNPTGHVTEKLKLIFSTF